MRFAIRHARRELRSSWRRLALHMSAIALGVAALVAINSFRDAVERSLAEEGKALLGADVRLEASFPLSEGEVGAALDSMRALGVDVAEVTRLASMVRAVPGGEVRLLQVRAVEPGYPFYGDVDTEPAGLWPLEPAEARALVDPAVLIQLGLEVGDTLAIGEGRFAIAGTVDDLAGDVGIQTAIGPRVYIPRARLAETGLLGLGSLVEHQAYLRAPDLAALEPTTGGDPDAFFRPRLVDYDTARERIDDFTDSLGFMARFLALVGLIALLLGGVGVGSAVNVFVRERLPSAAVLRCLGARQRTVFAAYLLETTVVALAGAAAGALLGLAVQAVLPLVLGDFLPVEVAFRPSWGAVLAGLGVGAWVGGLFALLPLLAVRGVAPLQALRAGFETTRSPRDPWRWLAYGALAATVVVLSVWQAPTTEAGLGFAGGLAGALFLLWLLALVLLRTMRRWFPARAAFVVRQGVANLFRPRNQTVAVTLALGLGVFLVTATWLVQTNLLDRLRVDRGHDRPNLLLFDIQTDQVDDVRALAESMGVGLRDVTPLVPARVQALNGVPVGALMADSAVEPWAVRREYRNTYRDSLVETEELLAGRWFDEDVQPPGARGLPRISIEGDVAAELGVGPGDRITWDVQGRAIETEVVNVRRVDWARFAPNFFVVFEPGVLEEAPQTFIALARIPDERRRAELQRALVARFPNVSALDLARVQEAVEDVLSRVGWAVRFLGLFTVAAGLVVLVGALAATRHQRLRESALLRTLGARRGQVAAVLVSEYAAVGALAALAGAGLAAVGGWLLVTRWFELPFRLPVGGLALVWVGTALLAAGVAFLGAREVVGRTPVALLRETEEA